MKARHHEPGQRRAFLGFNYQHLVRDLPGTLNCIHALLAAKRLFISKTPCAGEMNPLIRPTFPVMHAVGLAPYAGVFRASELIRQISAAGFEILAIENHASKGDDNRPYIVTRKVQSVCDLTETPRIAKTHRTKELEQTSVQP